MNTCSQGQGFGENLNPSYATAGYKGHTGVDVGCGFGTAILSPFDGYVYKVLTPQNPAADGSGFTGVFMLVDNEIESFEWLVGHCNPSVSVGMYVKKGDVIGTEANHGTVYAGNMQITLAMQRSGDQRGHHRHYQKRPVRKVLERNPNRQYLTSLYGGPFRDQMGFYYEMFAPGNGYSGCTNPLIQVLQRDLWYGSEGYDVYVLQRFLKKQGLFNTDTTGYFGTITAGAVIAFQYLNKITPLLGYTGPKTRPLIQTEIPFLLVP